MVWHRAACALLLVLVLFAPSYQSQVSSASDDTGCRPHSAEADRPGPTTARQTGSVGGVPITHLVCGPDGGDLVPPLVTGHFVYQSAIMTTLVEDDALVHVNDIDREVARLYPNEAPLRADRIDRVPFTDRVVDDLLRGEGFVRLPTGESYGDSWERTGRFDVQIECMAWINGEKLDFSPDPPFPDFPTDEEPSRGQSAAQDYQADRVVDGCEPTEHVIGCQNLSGPLCERHAGSFGARTDFAGIVGLTYESILAKDLGTFGDFVIAVEAGDCDPRTGEHYRFRGDLSFIDANGVLHEVHEYDYVCPGGSSAANLAKDLFPWTYTDADGDDGCKLHGTTGDQDDPVGSTLAGASVAFDLGHKCNGTLQDRVTERLWITRVHAPRFDLAMDSYYTYALLIDTCNRLNVQDLHGSAAGALQTGHAPIDVADAMAAQTDACFDGSSSSFDDTTLRRGVVHDMLAGTQHEVWLGNSVGEGTPVPPSKHREHCRAVDTWPGINHPPLDQPSCVPDVHVSALVDLYLVDTMVHAFDLIDHFELNAAWDDYFDGRTGACWEPEMATFCAGE